MRLALVLALAAALSSCDFGSDERDSAAATVRTVTTVAAPRPVPELAVFVTYRITTVPPVPSGLYRASGTFTATGAVQDAGSAELVYRITARGPDAIRGEETLRGLHGTLVVRFQASARAVGSRRLNELPGPTRIYGLGASRIARAGGVFARHRGQTGTIGYTVDFARRTTSLLQTFDGS